MNLSIVRHTNGYGLRRVVLVVLLCFGLVQPKLSQAASTPAGFADLSERLLPAVVNVSTTQKVGSDAEDDEQDMLQELPPLPPGSPFEELFRDFMERHKRQMPQQGPRKVTSLGSGFIIDPTGYIVTNNHVIQDADEITVILQDNTNLPAELVGRDKKTDLAVLRVKPSKSLPAVSWGDSDKMRVGDWIIAIGNPFGLGGTVTAGIISARARDINSGPYDDYLQTDASINRGNSGGPMFNTDGEVIGINTAIFSPSGGSIGIGFAIPSSLAKGVIDQLKAHGHTRRGWIGVHIQSVTPEIAESLGLGKVRGALVSTVTPKGPSAEAGVQSGDVILSFDGKDVTEMRRLPRIVAETDVDKTVTVGLWRGGKELSVRLKVGELESHDEEDEDKKPESKQPQPSPKSEKLDDLGLSIAPLSSDLRKRYEIKESVKGVLITSIKPNGLGAGQGLQEGDVIVQIGQKDVTTPAETLQLVKAAKDTGKPILLLINRNDDLRFIAVPLKKTEKEKTKER